MCHDWPTRIFLAEDQNHMRSELLRKFLNALTTVQMLALLELQDRTGFRYQLLLSQAWNTNTADILAPEPAQTGLHDHSFMWKNASFSRLNVSRPRGIR